MSLSVANGVYLGAGGGVRLYVGKSWGFKPEVRYQRYQGSVLQANSVLYAVGLFWQFGRVGVLQFFRRLSGGETGFLAVERNWSTHEISR